MPYADRPRACRIYPFVAIPILTRDLKIEKLLVLDVHACPNWAVFGKRFEAASKEYNAELANEKPETV